MKTTQNVQSVDRVFDIIEALSATTHGMTLTNLSTQVNLHVSTTHRLLASLMSRGYVDQEKTTNKYFLTPRLFEIGNRVVNGTNLLPLALPYIEKMADATAETIHLVARYGNEIVYLYKEESNNSIIRTASFVGMHSPMYCTGVGKSILAYLPLQEVEKIWNSTPIAAFTSNTITNYESLLADLEKIRSVGYSVDAEEHEEGITCVAAPIFNYTGMPVAAISVTYPTTRVSQTTQTEFAALAMDSAREISVTLGYSPRVAYP